MEETALFQFLTSEEQKAIKNFCEDRNREDVNSSFYNPPSTNKRKYLESLVPAISATRTYSLEEMNAWPPSTMGGTDMLSRWNGNPNDYSH